MHVNKTGECTKLIFSKLCASKNQDFPDQSIIFHKLKAVKGYPRLGDVQILEC